MNDDHHTHQDYDCHDEPAKDKAIKDSERQDQTTAQDQYTKPFLQQWRELCLDRKIESCIGLIGLTFAGILAWTAFYQLEAMKDQLTEMKNGSGDTKAIAESAKTQADSTKALATAAIDQVQQLAAGVQETKKLALATQDALSIAKDTERRQLRAYLVIGRMEILRFGVGNMAHVEGVIENIGQTPAHDAGWQSGINLFDLRAQPTFTYDDCTSLRKSSEYPRWSLGKNAAVEKDRRTVFTADEIKLVQDSTAAVYFHGRLCYLDIFEEEHLTDFCMYWKWENGRLGIGLRCPQSDKST